MDDTLEVLHCLEQYPAGCGEEDEHKLGNVAGKF